MKKLSRVILAGLFTLPMLNISANAQKKPLDHSVYDEWQSLGQKQISKNGDWVMYSVRPQEGDPILNLQAVNNGTKIKIERAANGFFTENSKYVFGIIKPFYKDQKLVLAKKLKKEKLAKDSLFVLNLANNEITKFDKVASFKFAKKADHILAYTTDVTKDSTKKVTKPNDKLKDLIVKNLNTNKDTRIKNILDYEVSTNGKWISYVVEGDKKDSLSAKGVFLMNTDDFKSQVLLGEKGLYKSFTYDENSTYLSFYGNHDDEKALTKYHKLYIANLNTQKIEKILDHKYAGVPKNWYISGDRKLEFSKNSKTLYLGLSPIPIEKDTVSLNIDKAVLDIWGNNDDYIQPYQLKNLEKEQKRSYLSFVNLDDLSKITQVSTIEIPEGQPLNEGNSKNILLITDFGKRIASQWTLDSPKTYYIYDKNSEEKTVFLTDFFGNVYPSPNGEYIVYYNKINKEWWSYSINSKTHKHLNKGLKVDFANELNDMPDYPRQYGLGFFSESDDLVYIYDRFDIWQFDLKNSNPAKIITNGFGRKNNIRFRIPKLHSEFKTVSNFILVTSFNEINKESGLYSIHIDKNNLDPKFIVSEPVKGYANINKAENSDYYIFTKETAQESANLYLSQNLSQQTQLTILNQNQKNYNWFTVELVKWKTNKRNKSEGLLYKPENFNPSKKYPMIVYFYEKNSDNLYLYENPAPTPSRLNVAYFVSNGYVVFVPDISYQDGHPGKSAEEYINSGVKHLIKENKWINVNKIGIQGQSWGGYQVAHLITRTDMYAAAWSGAPVVNMTSAYGGIRWSSGYTRQFQYEKTQSRIGTTPWENLDLYIENSPLFYFDKVKTPVAIMHNDNDGAVPWYQGIEMYTALRRLNKPVWMLNYNNDEHNLMKRQNRKDIQIRQQQFFDYYLKDAQAPVWMTRGVPATNKGLDWGFELTNEKVKN